MMTKRVKRQLQKLQAIAKLVAPTAPGPASEELLKGRLFYHCCSVRRVLSFLLSVTGWEAGVDERQQVESSVWCGAGAPWGTALPLLLFTLPTADFQNPVPSHSEVFWWLGDRSVTSLKRILSRNAGLKNVDHLNIPRLANLRCLWFPHHQKKIKTQREGLSRIAEENRECSTALMCPASSSLQI